MTRDHHMSEEGLAGQCFDSGQYYSRGMSEPSFDLLHYPHIHVWARLDVHRFIFSLLVCPSFASLLYYPHIHVCPGLDVHRFIFTLLVCPSFACQRVGE